MSHSRGVNSTGAEQVVGLMLVYSLWHKAVDAPWGMATRKNLLWWGVFTLPLNFLSHTRVNHLQPGALFHILLRPIDIPSSFFLEMR